MIKQFLIKTIFVKLSITFVHGKHIPPKGSIPSFLLSISVHGHSVRRPIPN